MNVPSTSRSQAVTNERTWPVLLTVPEAAQLLRTSPRGVYAMVERRQLPGVVRIRRRVLFRTQALLDWLDHTCASSFLETRR